MWEIGGHHDAVEGSARPAMGARRHDYSTSEDIASPQARDLLGLDCLAEPLPDGLARRDNVDIAVPGLEHTDGNARGMIIAGLRWDLVLHEPARGLESQHKNLHLQQRRLYSLPLPRHFPLQKGREHPYGAEQTST